MAIHSSTIAWKIPWTEEPGRLQSMGSQRVGHSSQALQWVWLMLWQPGPELGLRGVAGTGESQPPHGRRSLVGCSPWGR